MYAVGVAFLVPGEFDGANSRMHDGNSHCVGGAALARQSFRVDETFGFSTVCVCL